MTRGALLTSCLTQKELYGLLRDLYRPLGSHPGGPQTGCHYKAEQRFALCIVGPDMQLTKQAHQL